jgi:hypothetical protein
MCARVEATLIRSHVMEKAALATAAANEGKDCGRSRSSRKENDAGSTTVVAVFAASAASASSRLSAIYPRRSLVARHVQKLPGCRPAPLLLRWYLLWTEVALEQLWCAVGERHPKAL